MSGQGRAPSPGFEGPGPRQLGGSLSRSPVRRTFEVTLTWPTSHDGRLVVHGTAEDQRHGDRTSANISAHFGEGQRLVGLTSDPRLAELRSLLELDVGKGFRQAAEAVVQEVPASNQEPRLALVAQLLDELPVAWILAGYRGAAERKRVKGSVSVVQRAAVDGLIDVCAGWQQGSEPLRLIAEGKAPIAASPPVAPTVESLHGDTDPLPPDALRRRRILGVTPTESGHRIDAWFRDSYRPPDGPETVLHEYDLEATLVGGDLATCVATPRVLPFGQCPSAAGNVGRLVGTPLVDVRSNVRSELGGIDGCTHLNDLLRSLGAVQMD